MKEKKMKVLKDLKQNTDSWLEFRESHIGASDAPVIMGVSPWKTPYQLWMEKIGNGKKQKETIYMQRGNDLEPIALAEYNKKTGLNCKPLVAVSDEHDFLCASFDGFDLDKRRALEIKCPGEKDHLKAISGDVPEKYIPQLQHQMNVGGLENIDYFSFDGNDGVILTILRDQDYIDDMLKKELEFWECVQQLSPPPKGDKDFLDGDESWVSQAKKVYRLQVEEREVKKQKEEALAVLKNLSEGSTRGGGLKLSKYSIKGSVQYAKIPELDNIDLEKYRKPAIDGFKLSLEK